MERLSTWKVLEMYVHFIERPSERYVARMCGVSKNTVHKYRVKEGWDERLRNIKKRAREMVYDEENGTF